MDNKKEEPKTAPESERWYNLKLGSSYKDDSSKRYCTLRYEFKPASIDKTKTGHLKKNKENRVSVEFNNNQAGKPKVAFEGSNEEHKENDAVLFFDGETFRLERLHRAVNQLRLLRYPGESATAASAAAGASLTVPVTETRASPVGKDPKSVPLSMSSLPPASMEVERIDIGEPMSSGAKSVPKESVDHSVNVPNVSIDLPVPKNEEVDEHRDIDMEDLFGSGSPEDDEVAEDKHNAGFDINVPHNETDEEIADVDDSGDEVDKGPNAADALRAQVNAEGRDEQTSSSSSSGSGSSGSGSGSGSGSSSSSSSDGSDDDSVNSI